MPFSIFCSKANRKLLQAAVRVVNQTLIGSVTWVDALRSRWWPERERDTEALTSRARTGHHTRDITIAPDEDWMAAESAKQVQHCPPVADSAGASGPGASQGFVADRARITFVLTSVD
eukprot:SAG11_NODE_9077_length_946_cov_2.404959_1_plen_118_part_00